MKSGYSIYRTPVDIVAILKCTKFFLLTNLIGIFRRKNNSQYGIMVKMLDGSRKT